MSVMSFHIGRGWGVGGPMSEGRIKRCKCNCGGFGYQTYAPCALTSADARRLPGAQRAVPQSNNALNYLTIHWRIQGRAYAERSAQLGPTRVQGLRTIGNSMYDVIFVIYAYTSNYVCHLTDVLFHPKPDSSCPLFIGRSMGVWALFG